MKAAALILACFSAPAWAAPVSYVIDPDHTHPTFEADHFGGLSTWRGLFKRTSGTITLDTAAQTGTVDIAVEIASIDFGLDKLNDVAINSAAPPMFEAAKYPVAYYQGTFAGFVNASPTTVAGNLTLHGTTRPLELHIDSFKCIADHPVLKREVCGADASGRLDRTDFGIKTGQRYGFDMQVMLHIQVEAIRMD